MKKKIQDTYKKSSTRAVLSGPKHIGKDDDALDRDEDLDEDEESLPDEIAFPSEDLDEEDEDEDEAPTLFLNHQQLH